MHCRRWAVHLALWIVPTSRPSPCWRGRDGGYRGSPHNGERLLLFRAGRHGPHKVGGPDHGPRRHRRRDRGEGAPRPSHPCVCSDTSTGGRPPSRSSRSQRTTSQRFQLARSFPERAGRLQWAVLVPRGRRVRWSFDSRDLRAFRNVRDEIRVRIENELIAGCDPNPSRRVLPEYGLVSSASWQRQWQAASPRRTSL